MSQWLKSIIDQQYLDPEVESSSPLVPALAIELKDLSCLIGFAYLSEILEVPEVVPYPEPSKLHIGIINARGEVVPVLCLRSLLKLDGGCDQAIQNSKLIKFRVSKGHFAVIADSVRKVSLSQNLLEQGGEVALENRVYRVLDDSFFSHIQELVA